MKEHSGDIAGLRLLDIYVLREFMAPFFFCVLGFAVILMSGVLFELADLIFAKKVALSTVLSMLVYRLPGVLVITLPLAALFATLLSLGRLARDSEMTVIRCVGVSFHRLVFPVLVAALLISGLTYVANEVIVPWGNHRYETLLRQAIYRNGIPTIQENVFFRGGDNLYFYIGQADVKKGMMRDILVYSIKDGSGFPQLITAQSGRYRDKTWVLLSGVERQLDSDGFVSVEQRFTRLEITTDQKAGDYLGKQKSTGEMNRKELAGYISRFRGGGIDIRPLLVDYHMKLALPLSSLVFAAVGAPLSLCSARSGHFFGITLSIIISFLYYVSVSVCRSLGVNGLLPVLTSVWLPNTGFLLLAMVLIYRTEKV